MLGDGTPPRQIAHQIAVSAAIVTRTAESPSTGSAAAPPEPATGGVPAALDSSGRPGAVSTTGAPVRFTVHTKPLPEPSTELSVPSVPSVPPVPSAPSGLLCA